MSDEDIFSRDPEQWDKESLDQAVARISALVKRFRKARNETHEQPEPAGADS